MGSIQAEKSLSSKKNGAERRKYPRRSPSVIPRLKSVRLIAGPEVKLINVSRRGVLFETDARLAPRSAVALRLVTSDAILLLKGYVVRSILAVLKGSAIRYQSAVEFDEDFVLADSPVAHDSSHAAGSKAGESHAETKTQQGQLAAQPAASSGHDQFTDVLLVTAEVPQSGPELREMFGLNRW
jgi:hypothetical protein